MVLSSEHRKNMMSFKCRDATPFSIHPWEDTIFEWLSHDAKELGLINYDFLIWCSGLLTHLFEEPDYELWISNWSLHLETFL